MASSSSSMAAAASSSSSSSSFLAAAASSSSSSSSSFLTASASMASSSSSHITEEDRILSLLPYNKWSTEEHHQMNPSSLPALFPKSLILSNKLNFRFFPPCSTRLVVDKHPSILRPRPAKFLKGEKITDDDVYIDTNNSSCCETYGGSGSDPDDPVLGRLVAVNATYFCYSLEEEEGGGIGVLTLNRTSKPLSLIPYVGFRVTDMGFFAEDVHLLASASTDGRIFVWKINEEDPEEEGHKLQITGQIIIAVQMEMDGVEAGESVYPRVCWHSHIQEVLVVGIGKNVVKIDSTLFGKSKGTLSADKPLKCHINNDDNLIDGILIVGKHVGDVTLLSFCEPETIVSASKDGQVKIWDCCRELAVLSPYGGEPVRSLTCLTSPHCPGHTILITAGQQCKELKLWSSVAESWECTQTLKFNSFAQAHRVIALPDAGFLLLVNAKQSVVYAVRIKYGLDPSATRMDYMARFGVSMPILNGTSDSIRDRDHIIKVYCLQTQVLQVYELDVSQFLPSPKDTSLEHASTSHHSSGEEYQKILSQLLAMQTELQTQLADLAFHDAEHQEQLLSVIRMLTSQDADHQKQLKNVVDDLAAMITKVDNVCQGMANFTTDYKLEMQKFLSPLVLYLEGQIKSLQMKSEAMSKGIAEMNITLNQLSANAGANSEAGHRKELSRLMSEGKYEQTFILALESKSDASDVLWLCPQIDLGTICSEKALTVGVLMLVLDRLASSIPSIDDDVLGWMKIMADAIYPTDPLVFVPVFTMLIGLLDKLKESSLAALKDIIRAKMHHLQMSATKFKIFIPPLEYKKIENFIF